jgi:Dynamin family
VVSGASSDTSPAGAEPATHIPLDAAAHAKGDDARRHELLATLTSRMLHLEESLLRPPQVVLLGEGNVGKSSVANLLLGQTLLPTSVIENTRTPLLLRYSKKVDLVVLTPDGRRKLDVSQLDTIAEGELSALEVGLPSERLRIFEILDTPGPTGTTWLEANPIQRASRLLLWCTSAIQAWKESEQRLYSGLSPELRRHALLVVTHKDQLRSEGDRQRVENRLQALTRRRFRSMTFVNGRASLAASLDPHGWQLESGKRQLEGAIMEELTAMRIRRIREALRILTKLARLQRENRRLLRDGAPDRG